MKPDLEQSAQTISTDDLSKVIARVDGWRKEELLTRARSIAEDLVAQRYDADDAVREEALEGIKRYVALFLVDLKERGYKRDPDKDLEAMITEASRPA